MTSAKKMLMAAALTTASAACSHGQPYQISGPVLAKEGVQMAVVGEQCTVNRSAEQYPTSANDDRLDLTVKVQLSNPTDAPVLLARDRFRLSEQKGAENVPLKPTSAGVVTVLPGETSVVPLSFERSGEADCRRDLWLEPGSAVELHGRSVAFAPIRFTATR